LIEYVLIPGVNDTPTAAEELATWLGKLPCRVNVIPYNPKVDSPWPAPEECQVSQFVQSVAATGLSVNRRRTTGRTVMAACGQLGAK
jgi:23S rRNA (adenine2503-C2)-methyltransferase